MAAAASVSNKSQMMPDAASQKTPFIINQSALIAAKRASIHNSLRIPPASQANRRKMSMLMPQNSSNKSADSRKGSDSSSNGDRTTVSAAEHIVKKFRQKFIILHYSPFKAVWDWIVLLLVVYTAIFTPFTVAFLLNEDEKRAKLNQHASTRIFKASRQRGADPFVIVDLIVDLMFLLDIFINFRTTFVSKEGEAVYDPMIIAKNYLRGWFLIDACSAMPYDLILFGSGNIDTLKITGLLKTTRLIRLIRILPKLQKFSEYGLAMLLLLVAAFGLVGHWLACVFYAIAYLERPTLPEPKYSWLDHLAEKYNMPYVEDNSESGPDLKSKYITALFFTLTSLTSVGFGNVSPTTNWEKIFSIASMLLGSLISAAIFGNVTTIMIKMYQGNEELKEMQDSIKDFIKFHNIPKMLSKRMTESFEHTWSYTNGIDMNTVLKSFPESLQADICLHLNRQLLSKSPAFQDAGEGCLRMLAMQFKSTHVPPGDTLIHKGDNLISIYFIACGTLEISRDGEVLAILDKNDIFGENIGKYQERDLMGRSSCDVTALSYCDLHKIDRCDLLDVLEIYPDFAESFERKFQVTFDLRECEMLDQKPIKKKSTKAAAMLKLQTTVNTLNRFASMSTTNPAGNESAHAVSSLLHHQSSTDLHRQDTIHASKTSLSVLRPGASPALTLNSSLTNVSPDSSVGNHLNNSSSNATEQHVINNNRNLSVDSATMSLHPNPTEATRKFSSLLRKKSKLIRTAVRLNPMFATTVAGSSSNGKPQQTGKRQVSSLSEVETELDYLITRLNKAEDSLKSQMETLNSFVLNLVSNESNGATETTRPIE